MGVSRNQIRGLVAWEGDLFDNHIPLALSQVNLPLRVSDSFS